MGFDEERVELTHAGVRRRTQAAKARDVVGDVEVFRVGDVDGCRADGELGVKIVVRHVQPAICALRVQPRRPLHRAREVAVCGVERRFPHLTELVQQIGDCRFVGLVVEEDDYPLLGENHACQGRPVVESHGNLGWDVGELCETRVFERSGEVVGVHVVAVADEDGDDVVWVDFDPVGDFGEVRLGGAGVEEVA